MRGLPSILSLFGNEFNKFNNTEAQMLDSIYHMPFKKNKICMFGVNTPRLCLLLSLSDTEHGWAHGSNTVHSVIHGLTNTSIELQLCLGMSWYNLDSNVARVCTNKARMYSIKQDFHDLQNDFHTIVVRF